MTFSKIIWQHVDMACHCPRDLTFPWQAYFYRYVFFKVSISLILKLNISFLAAFFKSLDYFLVFLFGLVTFDRILDDFFELLDKFRNLRWRTKMATIQR